MECKCGHQLDITFTHLNGTCVWTCCGASWEKSKCKEALQRDGSGDWVDELGNIDHFGMSGDALVVARRSALEKFYAL